MGSFRKSGNGSSFSGNCSNNPKMKHGPNATSFISCGIPHLDKILGGGFCVGSLVMIMEDAEAPHHMLLLRNFMSQGLVHKHPLLYASPNRHPKLFLGTLPSPSASSSQQDNSRHPPHEKDLRIAWQYKKYFGEPHLNISTNNGGQHDYCNDFDLRKPLERHFFSGTNVDCVSIQDSLNLDALQDRCAEFLAQLSRNEGNISSVGRIAIQSFCSPQCKYSDMEWHMLSFIKSLKGMTRSSNAVVVVTFPPSLLSPSCSKRLQHMADTLLSVRAIPDEDKELAKLLTGYQDMVGFLNVHKVARLNTQVPVILDATTFSIKLEKRRFLVLECLNQAPVDGSSGSSYGTSGGCSGSTKSGSLDF